VIKLAPVVRALARDPQHHRTTVISSGQHRDLMSRMVAAIDRYLWPSE